MNLGKPPALLLVFFIGLFGLALSCGGSASAVGSDGNSATAKIGGKVGERIPDVEITLIDGSTVKTSELVASGQPTFLFFFATW